MATWKSIRDKARVAKDPRYWLLAFGCHIIIFTICILLILITLSVTKEKPNCYIQNFYVPALNRLENPNVTNKFIFFDLELENQFESLGVRYGNLNLSFYYGRNTSLTIGNYTVQRFYEGHKKKAQRRDVVETHGVPWDDAVNEVSNGSTVFFRLDLVSRIKYKEWFLYSRMRPLKVGANVEINNLGKKVERKAIQLTSGSSQIGHGYQLNGIMFLFMLWLF